MSSDTCLSKPEQQLPNSSLTLSSSDSSGAWIFSHFRIQVRSSDECVVPGRHQPRETHWSFDGRLSSAETNLKVGLLPLLFMQLLLSHMFLSFMVWTSPSTLSQPVGHIVPPPPLKVHFLEYLKNALSYGLETFWQFKWTNFQNTKLFSTASALPWLP